MNLKKPKWPKAWISFNGPDPLGVPEFTDIRDDWYVKDIEI